MLSDFAEIVAGVTKGRKFNGKSTVTVPYMRVANVQAGFLDLTEIKGIEVLPQEARDLELKPGDVLLTEGGDYDKLGRGALWEGQMPGCIHQNHVFRVRPDPDKLLPRFLHEYLSDAARPRVFPQMRQAHHEPREHQHDTAAGAPVKAAHTHRTAPRRRHPQPG